MTLAQATQRIRRIQKAIPKAAKAADRRIATIAFKDAKIYSSGTLSSSELRRMGHPYARRHGGARVPGDTAIINRQGGEFFSAWRIMPTDKGFWVINDSRVAKFMKGTRFMISRPIQMRIYERTNYMRRAIVREELRKAFR